MITIEKIKELRAQTQVSLGKCKEALIESQGNIEGAKAVLHEWELLKSTKTVADSDHGLTCSYIHNGRIGVLLDVRCQTESASKHKAFKDFCEMIMFQIVSTSPSYITSDDVPKDVMNEVRSFFEQQVESNPVIKKERKVHVTNIKMKRWLSQVCLMHQRSVQVEKKSIEDLRVDLMASIKEDVVVKRFARFEIGE